MTHKLISIMIMVVVGLALLPVVSGFTNDVQRGPEIDGTFTETSYAVDTVYDLDFDATEDNLEEADITVDGELLVENGTVIDPTDTYEYAGTSWTFTDSSGDTLVLSTDTDTLELTGTGWTATGDVELVYTDYDEPSQAIQSLVGILPVIYVVMMVVGTVTFIKMK